MARRAAQPIYDISWASPPPSRVRLRPWAPAARVDRPAYELVASRHGARRGDARVRPRIIHAGPFDPTGLRMRPHRRRDSRTPEQNRLIRLDRVNARLKWKLTS